MSRALQHYFGVEPDLDIEAQRAVVVLRRPMSIDWQRVDESIRRANYTFGGAHLRTRGTFLGAAQGDKPLLFEVDGTDQRLVVANLERVQGLGKVQVEVIARVEGWQTDVPHLVILGVTE